MTFLYFFSIFVTNMSNRIEILTIIDRILGTHKQTGDDNYAYFCPFCNHYKRKLELNLETFNYHCWTCTPKKGGKNFYFLFKSLTNVDNVQLEKIKEYTNTPNYIKKKISSDSSSLNLPKEFKSMNYSWNDIEYKHANVFLKKRKITDLDIKKYNIGYCPDGEYGGRIIIPSYDESNQLNYFVSRSFFNDNLKYKNPKVSKNIIAFESHINYNYPIVLCEGVFDAIALRRNAIPLLGKMLNPLLKSKLDLHKVSEIYISLDNDAREDAVKMANELMSFDESRKIYLLNLDKKDPSEIGFEGMISIIKNSEVFDFKKLIFSRLFE